MQPYLGVIEVVKEKKGKPTVIKVDGETYIKDYGRGNYGNVPSTKDGAKSGTKIEIR